ncbi:MAG: UvrD-helicase domain-containing protein, partial [Bilophila sp.]
MRQIRASAGSGKTYELTTSFLTFLATAGEDATTGCGIASPGPHAWPEILAVTFTNRAASEMQERIIGRLKDTALGIGTPAPGWTQEQAARWIAIIVRRYGSLNVRTIDSLLHLIVRLAALELDLPPDFEPVFDIKDALAPLLDAVLEQTRHDQRLKKVLENACRDVFFNANYHGFMVGTTLRDNVLELLLLVMQTKNLASPDDVAAHLAIMLTELRTSAEQISRLLGEEKLAVSSHFTKALTRCMTDKDTAIPPNSVMLRKVSLDDCLLKASKGAASDLAMTAFIRLRKAVDKLEADGVLLRSALKVMPFVELARELADQVPDFIKQEGTMPATFVPRLAEHVLSGEYGVSEAFCRLGTSLTHILVDEFQDTSREQWQAMRPLVLEALSRGGSLTWVGDVKQAVYGWRGGDATLFDEVLYDPELTAVAPKAHIDPLPTNWRSCRAIVTTNNNIFSRLADVGVSRAVLSAMLPQDTPAPLLAALLDSEAKLLQDGFKDAGQALSAGKADGFLHLQRIHGEKNEDLDAQVQERLLECLEDLGDRRPWGDVTVLVRSNTKASLVAGWLMAEGIPVVTENSFLLAEHPLIIQLTGLLGFLDSPRDDLSFWTFLSGNLLL